MPAPPVTKNPTVTASEASLRGMVQYGPKPVYPPASLDPNTRGVAVASVTVGLTGAVEEFKVVEAPDAATSEALRAAITQWSFGPVFADEGRRVRVRVRGMLTFYLCRNGDGGAILNPGDVVQGDAGGALQPNTAYPWLKRLEQCLASGRVATVTD